MKSEVSCKVIMNAEKVVVHELVVQLSDELFHGVQGNVLYDFLMLNLKGSLDCISNFFCTVFVGSIVPHLTVFFGRWSIWITSSYAPIL